MANRRMFSMKVIDTDAFCEMPPSSQNLYFHIGMRADDDGFYASTRGLMLKINSSPDDLKLLIAKGFLLDRGDGVYVVKHWKMNNYLQKDRYQPTEYEEKAVGLFMKKDGSYTLHEEKGVQALLPKGNYQMYTPCIQDGDIGKNRIEENSVDKLSIDKISTDKISAVNRRYKEGVDCIALADEYAKLKEQGIYEGTLKDYLTEKGAYEI